MVSLDMGLSVSKLDSILTHQRLFLVGSRDSVRFFWSLELLEIYVCQHSLVRFVFFSETHYIITESMSKMSKICRKFGSFEVVLHPNERHVQDSWYHRKGFFHPNPLHPLREKFFVPMPNQNSWTCFLSFNWTCLGIQMLILPWYPNRLKWTQIHLASRSLIHENHQDVFRNSREVGEVESSALQYSTTHVDVL